MARTRSIAPGFFKNEQLGECSAAARLFFAGLWCWADREGRVEDRPKRLRAEILPYDQVEGEALVSELISAGVLGRYEASGVKVLEILNFSKYQDPHPREAPSILPARDGFSKGEPKADPRPTQGEPGEEPSQARPSRPSRPSSNSGSPPDLATDPRGAGAADAAAVLAGRIPQGKGEALAARYPLTAQVAKLLGDEWDEPPTYPAQPKRDQVERDIARLGTEHAADLCFSEGEQVVERGGDPPKSMGFFADLLAKAKPKAAGGLAPRGPRENPRPGDPDFNNPDAWWDYDAWLRRDAISAGGGARG